MKAIMRLIQKLEIGDISKKGKGKFIKKGIKSGVSSLVRS